MPEILFNNLIEQGLLGTVALITAGGPFHLGILCPDGKMHDSRSCDTVSVFSINWIPDNANCLPVPIIACQFRSLPLHCKKAFFISYIQLLIVLLIGNTMKNTMLRNFFKKFHFFN